LGVEIARETVEDDRVVVEEEDLRRAHESPKFGIELARFNLS
jgi:hypothetical protein